MPQRVDPFLPGVPSSSSAGFRPQSRPLPPTRKPETIDGFFHESQQHIQHRTNASMQSPYNLVNRPRPSAPLQQRPQTRQIHQTTNRKPNAIKPAKRTFFRKVGVSLIVLVVLSVSLFLQSLMIGELFVIAYAIFAFVRRIHSRTTFLLALLSLFCIMLLLILRSNNQLASNFAVYTFLLLAIGTISLGREVRASTS